MRRIPKRYSPHFCCRIDADSGGSIRLTKLICYPRSGRTEMRTLKTILVVSLLAYSAASMAQLYECTNSDGKKTYAKVCPNDTVKEKELGDPALVSPGPPVTTGA